jgi:hypothetical protein
VITRLKALRSLRWNYTRKGAWTWLRGRHCFKCVGTRRISVIRPGGLPATYPCSRCEGDAKRGYQRILSEPETVLSEQAAIAEGVM